MPKRVSQSDMPTAGRRGSLVMQILLGGLICWRLMLPPESSILGDTLWVAQATLAAIVVWACLQLFGNQEFVKLNRWDALVWLTIAGHAISTALLWKWGGDQRAGLNLCWEWVSLGALFFLLRQTIRTREEAGSLIRMIIAIAVCFAGLGIWQRYYEHDKIVQEYREMQSRYDELQALSKTGRMSSALAQELRKNELEFSQSNIPLDGPGRVMFLSRLQYSSEPTARWALANSLGGFLATGLVLCTAFLHIEANHKRHLFSTIVLFGLLGFTLYLTHSRTAWVGCTLAVIGIVLDRWKVTPERRLKILKVSITLGVIGAILFGIFLFSVDATNLDGNFVTRSLKTRIQYWIASAKMLSHHPIFGVGTGNFRQHYLAYKLPESSEEIQDPHNFALDLWANGGLISVLAWLGMLGLIGRELCRNFLSPGEEQIPQNSVSHDQHPHRGILTGLLLALSGLFFQSVLRDRDIAWELLVFAFAIPLIEKLLSASFVSRRSLKTASLWGILAMSVHLLGAGGMEMPGIVTVLLILIAVVLRSKQSAAAAVKDKWYWSVGFGICGVALSLGCFRTATSPVYAGRSLIGAAYYQMSVDSDPADARQLMQLATKRDPWAAEPWRQLAELDLSGWRMNPQDEYAFERACDSLEQARLRDPWSSRDVRFLGEMYRARFELTKERGSGERALEEFERADTRTPHHERILLQIALLADALNLPEKAETAANKAIEIDRISRRNGHWEKLLSDEELDKLSQIVESR